MASSTLLVVLLAVTVTLTVSIKIFDKGDCSDSPDAAEMAQECSEGYAHDIPNMTDERFNKIPKKEQETVKEDYAKMKACMMIKNGVLGEGETINKDALIIMVENDIILDPPCRKELLMKKVRDCLKNYKGKAQNTSSAICLFMGQQTICDKGYKSPDPSCKF